MKNNRNRLNLFGILHYAFGIFALFFLCYFIFTKFSLTSAISWAEAQSADGEEISGVLAMAVGSVMLMAYFLMLIAAALYLGGLSIGILISGFLLRRNKFKLFSAFVAVAECLAVSGVFMFARIPSKIFFTLLFMLGICTLLALVKKNIP